MYEDASTASSAALLPPRTVCNLSEAWKKDHALSGPVSGSIILSWKNRLSARNLNVDLLDTNARCTIRKSLSDRKLAPNQSAKLLHSTKTAPQLAPPDTDCAGRPIQKIALFTASAGRSSCGSTQKECEQSASNSFLESIFEKTYAVPDFSVPFRGQSAALYIGMYVT